MSPETATQDRIYRALKQAFSNAEFAPYERIDIGAVADRHLSSVTPVREALSRLVGEGLLEHRAAGGFQPVLPTAQVLAQLYRAMQDLCGVALDAADRQELWRILRNQQERRLDPSPLGIAHAAADFFSAVAGCGANRVLQEIVDNLNERLLLARLAEHSVLLRLDREMRALRRNQLIDIRATLVNRIGRYHARRIAEAEAICRALERQTDGRARVDPRQ